MPVGADVIGSFGVLFAVFVFLGFYGSRWRKGDLNQLSEWALAGRRLGTFLAFFLVGADVYTAYTFVAVPSGVFASGSLYFFAVPYVAITFGIAIAFTPKLWKLSREKGYVTGSDYVRDKFQSRSLGILTAITGIVAVLPYIALQLVGMQAVLASMLVGVGDAHMIEEIALLVAVIVLAAFTFTSGLRGATLTAVFKDALVWTAVITVIVAVLIKVGSFAPIFSAVPGPQYVTVPSSTVPSYATLVLGSAIALYLYPHTVNGTLSAQSPHKLRLSTSFLPLYGLGLAFLALFGIIIYSLPSALAFLKNFPAGSQGIYVVPSIILDVLPGWLAGVALLGVFVGGLVPAAIMAIAQANLLTRNIIKEYRPSLTAQGESRIAKWVSAFMKFLALAFVFLTPATYAIQLQLLGGILIAQLFPSFFVSLYTNWFRREGLIVGLLAGTFSGIYMAIATNAANGYQLKSSLFASPFGSLYIAVIALAINLVLAGVISYACRPKR
ncbi:MAG: sodium:solute symporter [Nitrososphaerota archaeon]|nr:sodium:solute symporter [Nitrososphaerota archaeon]MDG7023938.1 sodium:solute symporter [Nitrososphaerota archaeon]